MVDGCVACLMCANVYRGAKAEAYQSFWWAFHCLCVYNKYLMYICHVLYCFIIFYLQWLGTASKIGREVFLSVASLPVVFVSRHCVTGKRPWWHSSQTRVCQGSAEWRPSITEAPKRRARERETVQLIAAIDDYGIIWHCWHWDDYGNLAIYCGLCLFFNGFLLVRSG